MPLSALKGLAGDAVSKAGPALPGTSGPPPGLGMGLEDDPDMSEDAELSAAEDVMIAQEKGDAAGYRDALKSFFEACYPELASKSSDYSEE